MHLLVIEDERALCETIVRSLRRLAYSVDYCFDGEKALELLGTERYDLVLLDLNLPGKDGMTVLRTLRQADWETKVLILSARGEVEDKVEGLDAGMVSVVAGLVGPGLSSFDTPMERWISNGSRVVHAARVARIAIVL